MWGSILIWNFGKYCAFRNTDNSKIHYNYLTFSIQYERSVLILKRSSEGHPNIGFSMTKGSQFKVMCGRESHIKTIYVHIESKEENS